MSETQPTEAAMAVFSLVEKAGTEATETPEILSFAQNG